MKKKINSETSEKKTFSNKITISIIIVCVIISLSFLFFVINMDSQSDVSQMNEILHFSSPMETYIDNLSKTHTVKAQTTPYFHLYLTDNDAIRINQNLIFMDGIRILLNDSNEEQLVEEIMRNDKSVVIYPVFTSAAYSEPGFYTYFGGRCDQSCVTDLSFENPEFQYTSSGATAQILYHAGYDFLTDVQVDQNPELLDSW